jgi:protein-S-isoprenylcysteine O-methyltransferase Ste14
MSASSSGTPISPTFVSMAMAAERYVLPWIYGLLAWQRLGGLRDHYRSYSMMRQMSAAFHAANPGLKSAAYAALTKDVLMVALMTFAGVTLLFARPAIALPSKLKHVLVPIAMSYYFLLYGMVDRLPLSLRESLLPVNLHGIAATGGLVLSVIGYSIAIWALLHLGRSFAILVSVRKLVSSGPYAYVRHPIYLGYVIDLCGLVLANTCLGMLGLGAGFVMLLVIRAQMEEEMLGEADEGYRNYISRTGFLLPRLVAR